MVRIVMSMKIKAGERILNSGNTILCNVLIILDATTEQPKGRFGFYPCGGVSEHRRIEHFKG